MLMKKTWRKWGFFCQKSKANTEGYQRKLRWVKNDFQKE